MKIHILSRFAITAFLILSATGCTTQNVYDGLRYNRDLECREIQGSSERAECLRGSGMSYDEYQRELNKQQSK